MIMLILNEIVLSSINNILHRYLNLIGNKKQLKFMDIGSYDYVDCCCWGENEVPMRWGELGRV